ncbi:protein FMC1 homolog [Oppia nitens]|uniref:protein FMC1 homolog n=1 Tax=Oppia nitens TaxID=1686743 RepID=UPI0023DA6E30|nr:protein FMC1 homolog [Oppia nitens]
MSSSVTKFNDSLRLLRSISHELRRLLNGKRKDGLKVIGNEAIVYMFDMYRRHDVTDQRVCRPKHELKYLADTYRCYLNSSRNYQQIYDQFYSKGERSVTETAQMLGFKLPNQSQESPKE